MRNDIDTGRKRSLYEFGGPLQCSPKEHHWHSKLLSNSCLQNAIMTKRKLAKTASSSSPSQIRVCLYYVLLHDSQNPSTVAAVTCTAAKFRGRTGRAPGARSSRSPRYRPVQKTSCTTPAGRSGTVSTSGLRGCTPSARHGSPRHTPCTQNSDTQGFWLTTRVCCPRPGLRGTRYTTC